MTRSASPRADIHTRVTDRILADLEQGVRPWFKPWSAGNTEGRITRPLRHNGLPYSGINILLLWSEAMAQGFTRPTWMTFRQASALGAHVRKGEHGAMVVYANTIQRSEEGTDGEDIERRVPFLKAYTVFNVEQIEGLPEPYLAPASDPVAPLERIARADAFITAAGVTVRHGGNDAYYSMASDHVQMPPLQAFTDPESYYATLAHESIHWTRHPSRLDRSFGRKTWGDEGYAREELVAELGSAFLCADLGITPEPRPDHAAYLASWLKVLKDDKRCIVSAAAHASRAADFLHALQPNAEADRPDMQAA